MVDFEGLRGATHREAAGRLLAAGWDVCGVGDWAVVWRSPDGSRVARVCAFEPAFGFFVRLCRNLAGHPMLPRIDFDAALPGGGRLTVMEFLLSADGDDAKQVTARWEAAPPGDPVTAVRSEAERLDCEARAAVPYWGGLDRNPGNVMRRTSGELVLVDLFYAAGPEIYKALLEEPAAIAEAFAPEQRVHIGEIAAVARYSHPEEITALRAVVASIS
jgi:hypothetical protein